MKKVIILIVLFLGLVAKTTYSQQNSLTLSGEGNTDHVKLFWYPNSWDSQAVGFKIKRRVIPANGGNSEWNLLSKSTIIPACSKNKSYFNVTNLSDKASQLKQRFEDLVNGTVPHIKLREMHAEEYSQILIDEMSRDLISIIFYKDFDIALIHGFGYIDYDIPKDQHYEYGVFVIYKNGKEELSAIYNWEYGQKDQLEVPMQATYKFKKSNKSVRINWAFNSDYYFNNKKIAGFDIFKSVGNNDFIKINSDRILVDKDHNNMSFIKHLETNIDETLKYKFAVAPISLFNTLGEMTIIEPVVKHAFEKIAITDFSVKESSEGSNVNLNFKWGFDQNFEKLMDGYYLCQSGNNFSLDTISSFMTPDTKAFTLKNFKAIDGKLYSFSLIGMMKNMDNIFSNQLNYFYVNKPKKVTEFSGTPYKKENSDNIYIKFSWDKINPEYTYNLYQSEPNDLEGPLILSNSEPITENKYDYFVGNSGDDQYRFQLVTVDKDSELEGEASETLLITVPNYKYGKVLINAAIQTEPTKALMKFGFYEYKDLKGFRIYLNKQLVADENEVGKDSREYTLNQLSPGMYKVTIQAISTYDIISPVSNFKTLIIDKN